MLVTGARGLLGREIVDRFRSGWDVRATDQAECDVKSFHAVRRAVRAARPDVVVHCASYTAVDRAEGEEASAFAVNALGTRHVARASREAGALVVAYGSDYVFDGTQRRPYVEDDPTRPLSAYARTKRAAEDALREETPEHLLVRTQWLFGPHGRNFVRTLLEQAGRGETLRVVSDQVGCPTAARDVAEATERLLAAGGRGTVHFSAAGETSWHGLAAFALREAGFRNAPLEPVATADYPLPAPRPAYSVLSKERYRRTTGADPPSWEEGVLEYLSVAYGTAQRNPISEKEER